MRETVGSSERPAFLLPRSRRLPLCGHHDLARAIEFRIPTAAHCLLGIANAKAYALQLPPRVGTEQGGHVGYRKP